MPRYHLSVRHNGHLYHDDEGEEAPSDLEITIRAGETARDLIGTSSYAIPDWLDCTLEVTDAGGRVVLNLPFADAVDKSVKATRKTLARSRRRRQEIRPAAGGGRLQPTLATPQASRSREDPAVRAGSQGRAPPQTGSSPARRAPSNARASSVHSPSFSLTSSSATSGVCASTQSNASAQEGKGSGDRNPDLFKVRCQFHPNEGLILSDQTERRSHNAHAAIMRPAAHLPRPAHRTVRNRTERPDAGTECGRVFLRSVVD